MDASTFSAARRAIGCRICCEYRSNESVRSMALMLTLFDQV